MRLALVVLAACSGTAPTTTAPVPVRVQPPVAQPVVQAPPQLAAGKTHTCLLERGAVWCWGKNDDGQLGDGTKASSAHPVKVAGLVEPMSIALGEDHTCALVRDGRVFCWGRGNEGQLALGDGTPKPIWTKNPPPSSLVPIEVRGVRAVEIAAGHRHTCARRTNGELQCWGHDSYGELGGAELAKDGRVPGVADATKVRIGDTTTCILRRGGTVTCWGGHWSTGLFENQKRTQPATEVPALAGVEELEVGSFHACGIKGDKLICRGESNALGDPTAKCCAPATSTLAIGATQVALGFRQSCALLADGTVVCWAPDNRLEPQPPKPIAGLANVRQIAMGESHACALRESGEVACWGNDDFGQLGRGLSSRVSTPTRVAGLDDAKALAIGYVHSCALRANGKVACWPAPDRPGAYDVVGFGTATAISAGIYETCVVGRKGATCMHRDVTMFEPGKIALPPKSDHFVVGGGGICVRTKSHGLACTVEIMDAHRMPGALPDRKLVPLAAFANVDVVSRGARALCAADQKQITCVETDDGGWSKPYAIAGIVGSDVDAIATGESDGCALLRDGTISCWNPNHDPAKPIAGLTDVAELTAGPDHVCARRKDGTVWCWGRDDHGELGDGDQLFTPREKPTRVAGLEGALEIQAGAMHTCARTATGVFCWGSNEHGRLGSVFPRSDVPVVVAR